MEDNLRSCLGVSALIIGCAGLAYKFYRTKRKENESTEFYYERAKKALQRIPNEYQNNVREVLEMVQKGNGKRNKTIERLLEEQK